MEKTYERVDSKDLFAAALRRNLTCRLKVDQSDVGIFKEDGDEMVFVVNCHDRALSNVIRSNREFVRQWNHYIDSGMCG